VFAIALVTLTCGTLVASAGPSTPGSVRAVISFVGDSNESLSATALQLSVGDGVEPYADVFLALPGAGIRGRLCGTQRGCSAPDLWDRRISEAGRQIASDGFVVNLGINDTLTPGTVTGIGYAHYGDKIDWLMAAFGGRPVWWTNLPCSIEPPNRVDGCRAVNAALAAARSRWTNLKVLDWAAVARGHREYLLDGGNRVHQSSTGQAKWAQLVQHALDQRFPA
jgi:hypothetical protein